MRVLPSCLAAAAALACGGSAFTPAAGGDGGSPVGPAGGGASTVVLTLSTSGEGLIRGAGSDCRGNCTLTVAPGAQVTLQAVADAAATFSGWGGACSGTGACSLTLTTATSVTAAFVKQPPPQVVQHALSVVVEGPGSVRSSPAGLACTAPGTCTASFAEGTSVALVAAPDAAATFGGWRGACGGTGACSVALSADVQVIAHFDPPPPPPPAQVTLTVTTNGPGTVDGQGIHCGSGGTACRLTAPQGTSIALTASAADHARFLGWGGACSGNASPCALTLNGDASVSASFEDEVRVVWANDGRNLGSVLALNSTQVFFLRNGTQGWEIWSSPKAYGDPVKIVSAYATSIVAGDDYVYWTDGNNLYSMPAGGGAVSPLASAQWIGNLALDEQGALYWTSGSSWQSGAVHRMQDRADTVLASGQYPTALAVDARWAWFASKQGSQDGIIRRVPRGGGAVEDVADCQTCYPVVLRVDPTNFYYRTANGDTWTRGKESGTPILLSTKNGVNQAGWQNYVDLQVNAGVAWWNWSAYNSSNGIFRANADGTGWTAVDSGTDQGWGALRVDDTAAYYFHSGALIKRLK